MLTSTKICMEKIDVNSNMNILHIVLYRRAVFVVLGRFIQQFSIFTRLFINITWLKIQFFKYLFV